MQYEFNGFVLDVDAAELRTGGRVVDLQPQVFAVLAYLIEYRDRFVTKQELFDAVWGTRFVSESALTTRIKEARQAVGDDGKAQRVIKTVHGRGYRFVADIGAPPPGAHPRRLESGSTNSRARSTRRATGCRSRTRRSAKGRRSCSWAGSPRTSK